MDSSPGQIAIVGDLHSSWDTEDVRYFRQSPYDLVLFTGDLGASATRDGRRIARAIAGIDRRALVMPGNNDVGQLAELSAEFAFRNGMAGLMRSMRLEEPFQRESKVTLCGYGRHRAVLGARPITIITGRPFAMGGSELSFPDALARVHGVSGIDDSIARYESLVEHADTEDLVFLAHNGPTGLGVDRQAPWGSDFHAEPHDWGDVDLAIAVDRARARGHRTLAVIAGHMHHRPGRTERRWCVEREGVLYVNAARVPRIVPTEAGVVRHHVRLSMVDGRARADEVLVAS